MLTLYLHMYRTFGVWCRSCYFHLLWQFNYFCKLLYSCVKWHTYPNTWKIKRMFKCTLKHLTGTYYILIKVCKIFGNVYDFAKFYMQANNALINFQFLEISWQYFFFFNFQLWKTDFKDIQTISTNFLMFFIGTKQNLPSILMYVNEISIFEYVLSNM